MSYLLDNLAPQTGDRFAGLEACFDETTFRHLTAVGIGPGPDRRRGTGQW